MCIFATNITMAGLSISISNDITGRTTDAGLPVGQKYWVDSSTNQIVTDTADKLIFKLA
jgi:hypothetical protein